MNSLIENTLAILERTPMVLDKLLRNFPEELSKVNEGGETWSAFDIVGHLIHGEKTDWIARLEIVLSDGSNKEFTPFDRLAQFKDSKGKSLNNLLDEFKVLRLENIGVLKSKNISELDFNRTGIHPDFGVVTLKNLLATWAVHDLNHLTQISRVISHQYSEEVGPWKAYLRILNRD